MEDITCSELKERLEHGENIQLIDVREPFEHAQFNIGGKLIPLGTLPYELKEIEGLKDEEIVMYCRSGARSANAKNCLIQQGFTKVRNLTGGMIAWQD